nr:Gag-Pol polyprotein [Tanacetum cinerariifolium]
MAKATSSQAWLWHRHLPHLNFDTINLLSKNDIVIGLPKLKFVKDHLCFSCELGKAKGKSFQTKTNPSSKRRLQLLHMDLCGPMWVGSINGKKYVLVIVDDYSRYTWTHFLRSKDETHEVLIDFLKLVQRGLHAQAKAIATSCFTQNRSLVISRHEKTHYHIINDRKPSVKFFHIFGSLCYIVRDGKNLDKMKEKGDACIFVGYSTQSRAYRVFNKRTRVIVETIHVNFDELPHMALDHVSSDPFLNVKVQGETSSHHVVSSNMHTFYQRHPSEHRWTKDHPLEQVIGNPSQSVRTRPQLESDREMCMFALTVSRTKPKNIKEATADSAWIESMQEELHQFDRLDVWGLVDRLLCKNVINMKWLWKDKRDEENTVIRNKSHLVAKGYAQKEGVDFEESLHQLLGWKLFGCSLHMLHTNHSLFTKQSIGTPMATKHLDADLSGTPVDQTKYRIMVGALMYLIASRPDIVHATCYCAHYQAKPIEKHLTAVKQIFRYHFIKEKVEKGIVELFFVRTEYQLANLFNKALPEEQFKYLVRRLGKWVLGLLGEFVGCSRDGERGRKTREKGLLRKTGNTIQFFENSFNTCLSHLEKMLKQCDDTNLCLNWEKSHFMVKEGIVLGHKISKNKIEVDNAKVDVIAKLPHPTIVKGIRSFLGHVGFYRRFIKDFSKIDWPMTRLLEIDTTFFFSKECVEAFQTLKRKLTEAPILIALD